MTRFPAPVARSIRTPPRRATTRSIFAAVVLLALGTGCVSPTLRGAKVQLTQAESDVAGCKFLGQVEARPPFVVPNDYKIKLQNAAAELGADVVLHGTAIIGTQVGDAYDCREATTGTSATASSPSRTAATRLEELEDLRKKGLISQKEYDEKRSQVVDGL